jgi:hypothetical protein
MSPVGQSRFGLTKLLGYGRDFFTELIPVPDKPDCAHGRSKAADKYRQSPPSSKAGVLPQSKGSKQQEAYLSGQNYTY